MISYSSKHGLEKYKTNVDYWRVSIHKVLAQNSLLHHQSPYILSFDLGQNPVFWVDGHLVVKFFSKEFASSSVYEMEVETLKLLEHTEIPKDFPLALPKLVAHGYLYDMEDPWVKWSEKKHWYWPYCIQTYIRGQPLYDLWSQMSPDQRIKAACYLGKVLKTLHQIPIQHHRCFSQQQQQPWFQFHQFLNFQIRNFKMEQKELKLFDEEMVKEIMEYLPRNVESLVDDLVVPCFLHGDMTSENLLGTFSGGIWEPIGLIDFGDCSTGDFIYDLVSIHLDIFQCDKNLLLKMLKSYGIQNVIERKNFSYKAMCYTLLHKEPAFATVWVHKPEWKNCKNVKELEDRLWGLEKIE